MNEQELISWLDEWTINYRNSSGECESTSLRLYWHLQPYTSFNKRTIVAQSSVHTFVLYNSTYWIDVWSNCFFSKDFTKVTQLAGGLYTINYQRFWTKDINKDPKTFKVIIIKEQVIDIKERSYNALEKPQSD